MPLCASWVRLAEEPFISEGDHGVPARSPTSGADTDTGDGNGRRDGGTVAEPVAINPALAISGIEILGQWWYDPPSRATMQDCANTAIGVWSEYSLARSVVVAGGK